MSDVDLQLAREFFELNLFSVRTAWQQGRGTDDVFQLFVENSKPVVSRDLGIELHGVDLSGIERAAVEVRAWHADRFYPSVIESSRALSQFSQDDARARVRELFGVDSFSTILILSALPRSAEPRTKSLQLLQEAGFDHVIEFSTLLNDLLERVDIGAHYPGSLTLQTLRLLKRYRLVSNSQLEFIFHADSPQQFVTPSEPEGPMEPDDDEDETEET